MSNSLRMSFLTDGDKKVILSVPYAETTVTALDVSAAMQSIVTANIFTFTLNGISGAEIVQTTKTDLI